ncbi:hypothetical protein BU073_04375 [Mammaliicoccus vitulinus]|uniref:Uncharacterized protein n=1 Tax=Mammaliicoccus vitulinus TaxID=71237 RepID=A0A2T4PT48_9STAP|nr:hypothetical protein BU072_06940 [Mammaliicoccus vitulinus]PTI37075.1 hypothetical protein BU074_07095 [Mammaliicoccus vitulinus]PTI72073.1 hypothetical protein BU073_04375 [Mammaliicoccus vitulinus]RIN24592.1 hypothetical protein BU070_03010 [Mammaliicoccus vitulinus]
MPRGMARACSLSLILFPRASALCKIVENILKIFCYLSCGPSLDKFNGSIYHVDSDLINSK